MNHDQNDETIKEILEDDQQEIKKDRKKRSFLIRFLLFICILTSLIFGFIFFQQYLLDLEAEAIVRTIQTATAMKNETSILKSESTLETFTITDTPTPKQTIDQTATIAVQLTSVFEFQQTKTDEP